jgi:dipeptidase E
MSPELGRLPGENRRTAVIGTAHDVFAPEDRMVMVAEEIERLRHVGLDPYEVDLREYRDEPTRLRPLLEGVGLIWVMGGNTHVLARAVHQTGLDHLIPELVRSGVAYGGCSAGSLLAGPTLRGVELLDPPEETPEPWGDEQVSDGLGLVSFVTAVHVGVAPLESALESAMLVWEAAGVPYRRLHDGESILIDGETETLVRVLS